jgi:ABC-type polysaccharide/polyol phosphate export permease
MSTVPPAEEPLQDSPGSPGQLGPAPTSEVRGAAFGLLGALAGQFVLGMAANLYLTVPRRHPWTAAHPAWLLYLHVVYGIALLFGCLGVLFRCMDSGPPGAVRAALVALAGVAVALGAGVVFVADGQAPWASLLMALGFLAAAGGGVGLLVAAG